VTDDSPIRDPFATDGSPRRGGFDKPEPASAGADETRAPGSPGAGAIVAVVAPLLPCLPVVGGVLGIALGLSVRSEADRAGGRRARAALGTAGIVLGAAHLMLAVALTGGLIAYVARPSAYRRPTPEATVRKPVPTPPSTFVLPSHPSPTTPALPRTAPDDGVSVRRIGALTLVELTPDVGPLAPALTHQRTLARQADQTLLLWLVVPDCRPCEGVSSSLADPLMQQALGGTRVVRLNVQDFHVELEHLDVPVRVLPGFVLLGEDNHPLDYVHGGEWDEDIAKNIAPVLGKFLRGTLTQRRHPWGGPRRDDETPI